MIVTTPITKPEQVTPIWLTQVLQADGSLGYDKVTAIEFGQKQTAVDSGPGMQNNHIIIPRYAKGDNPTAPARLYLKLGNDPIHPQAGMKEVEFYTTIAKQVEDFPAVHCYHAVCDPEMGIYHLLLEDVSLTHRTVHPEQPATERDMCHIVKALARLHAGWWNHPQLTTRIGPLPTGKTIAEDFNILNQAFPGYIDFLDDRLSPQRWAIYEQVLTNLPGVLTHYLQNHHHLTLCHNDAHTGNILLPRTTQSKKCYIVDWEQWGIYFGIRDLAYQIALFWYPERRARLEQPLVKTYHQHLLDFGVQNYDWATCWDDYRLHTIENLFTPFWAWVEDGEQWGLHRWHQLEKGMLAFEDLGCWEFLG